MKHYLLYVLLLISPCISFAQDNGAYSNSQNLKNGRDIVADFLEDINDPNLALDVILSKWVIIDEPSDELYDYLEVSLDEIRLNLSFKKMDQLEIRNFNDLPRKEVKDIDPENLDVNNMFFIYYKNRLVTSIYVEDNKIGSFTLVSKGNDRAHFVIY